MLKLKIGVISDSHDNIGNLKKAFVMMKEQGVEVLIHCGDFCAPFMIKELEDSGFKVHCVFGNTDDRFFSTRIADKSENIILHGDLGELELGGKRIGITHFPKLAKGLACTNDYDYVFFGHNHIKSLEDVNGCKLVNPGELAGYKNKSSFAIIDTSTDKVEFSDVE